LIFDLILRFFEIPYPLIINTQNQKGRKIRTSILLPQRKSKETMTAAFIALLLTALPAVAPHMFVLEPPSRNYVANQSGEGQVAGKPIPEYTPQGLNGNTKVCGREGGAGINYDTWNDSLGNPMPWVTQGTYAIGGHVQIDILMTGKFLSL
jgi:hypothetical protein